MSYIDDLLGPGGAFSELIAGYKPRAQQIKVTKAIHKAIENKSHLVAEAPVATGKTFDVKTALQDLSFTYTSEPTPRWTLERAADAALLSTLQDAAKESGVELRIVRAGEKAARKKAQAPPAPRAPTCDVHGVPCVLRKCGPNAKPHNRGRRFWCCPRAAPETEDCFWEWEDGTKPFGEESQARFDKWLDSQGGCGICDAMGFLGMACNCDYDYDDE